MATITAATVRGRGMTTNTAEAFACGWDEGAKGTAAETAREAGARYPEFTSDEVTAYLNGADDGAKGDRFRLDGGRR